MKGFFSSCHYAESLELLILRHADYVFDAQNPGSIMKMIALEDIVEAQYIEFSQQLRLSFKEGHSILTIHLFLEWHELSEGVIQALHLEKQYLRTLAA